MLVEPLKSLGKKGKNSQNRKEFLEQVKSKEIPNSCLKARKGRLGWRTAPAVPVLQLFQEKPGRPRFGSVTVRGWNGSSGSGFRFRRFLCKTGFSLFSVQFNRKGWFRFRRFPVLVRFLSHPEKRFRRFRFLVPVRYLSRPPRKIRIPTRPPSPTPTSDDFRLILRRGQRPKRTKMDLFRPTWTEMDHSGPFWSSEC